MKPLKRSLCAGLALLLAVVFAASAAAGMAFSFRGGVTWDTTPEQMLAIEGLAQGAYNQQELNGYTFFYLKGQDVYYVFRGTALVHAYKALPESTYAAEQDTAMAAYGEPAGIEVDTVCALINAIHGSGTVAPEDLTKLVAWRLSDGTLATLFIIGGKTYISYFHEQRILGGV